MKKLQVLLRAPLLTASGYGVHARQVYEALCLVPEFELTIEPIRWGDTSYLHSGEQIERLTKLALESAARRQGGYKPDVSVQVTIPNEFRRDAPLVIGITAGIETTAVAPTWLQKCNSEIDLLIVPSKHSLDTFRAQYQLPNGETLRLQCPIAICPEGFDPVAFVTSPGVSPLAESKLPPKNLLFVGLGLDKQLGEDRKNLGNLLVWFFQEFKGREDVGLILKAGVVNDSLLDQRLIQGRIADIRRQVVGDSKYPQVTLVHGRLSDAQMAGLYRDPRVSAFVSLTHGEGFGLPLLEAAACGLPVVATAWSGHLDFLSPLAELGGFYPIQMKLDGIPASMLWQGVIEEGVGWAYPDEQAAKAAMRAALGEGSDAPQVDTRRHDRELFVAATSSTDVTNAHLADVIRGFVRDHVDAPEAQVDRLAVARQQLFGDRKAPTLLYTMPMSAGDVLLSTQVTHMLKERFPEHDIYFATSGKYAELLEGCPWIHKVIDWQQWMADIRLCEELFDEVYTPNLAVQMTFSNWVHRGRGRNILEEFIIQCGLKPLDSYRNFYYPDGKVTVENSAVLSLEYFVIHVGSGKDQWSARRYSYWDDVVANIKHHTGLKCVQVGASDDMDVQGVDLDLRGKTKYADLPLVIDTAQLVVSIDSYVMHLASIIGTDLVSIFGSSYATSTGPMPNSATASKLPILLSAVDRKGCARACYQNTCKVDPDDPCVNNIPPQTIVAVALDQAGYQKKDDSWIEVCPTLSGYTTVLNAKSQGFPYLQSIRSMLGFCSQVVVVDGESNDGTWEELQEQFSGDHRVTLMQREWDSSEPGMDGMQKAYARAMCVGQLLWQQDADEVVHESDYVKVKKLTRRFPTDVDVLHLPVIELWGDDQTVRTDRHAWKWRLSRNDFKITHGINANARVTDEKTGRVYAKKGQSDGCEYIDMLSGQFLPHKGFWTDELERLRRSDPESYASAMNEVFDRLPCVFHYSWADLTRKVRNFREFWDKTWSTLYNESEPTPRFAPDQTEEQIVTELRARGGEHGPAPTFKLRRDPPSSMGGWIRD